MKPSLFFLMVALESMQVFLDEDLKEDWPRREALMDVLLGVKDDLGFGFLGDGPHDTVVCPLCILGLATACC